MLSIPLKDSTSLFEYKADTFPVEVVNGTLVQYQPSEPYLAMNLAQNSHLTLSEAEMLRCKKHPELRICPADNPVITNSPNSCLASLFLQTKDAPITCGRRVLSRPPGSTLSRHGVVIVYYTNGPQQAFFQCKQGSAWLTTTHTLQGSGLIRDATSCHVSMEGIRLRPTLKKESQFNGPATHIYMPAISVVHSGEELQAVREMSRTPYFRALAVTAELRRSLEEVASLYWVSQHGVTTSMQASWYLPILVSAATTLALWTAILLGHRYARCVLTRCHLEQPETETPAELELEAPVPETNADNSVLSEFITEPLASTRYMKCAQCQRMTHL